MWSIVSPTDLGVVRVEMVAQDKFFVVMMTTDDNYTP